MLTVSHRRPKRQAATVVRRESLVMPAIAVVDAVETACIGVASIMSEGVTGVVMVCVDNEDPWRITVEREKAGKA